MGPNLEYAREKGNKIAQKMLENLCIQYIMNDYQFILPNSKERWEKAKADFIKSVEELFVEDACNTF